MDEKTADLVAAIEHATRRMESGGAPPFGKDPNKTWKPHCSAMFRETMRFLAAQKVDVPADFLHGDANTLGGKIRTHPNYWAPVGDLDSARALANKGVLVVGTQPGHIGIVYPVENGRTELLVRDGNIHPTNRPIGFQGKVYPSTYGAVPARKAFIMKQTQWYKYLPTE